MCTSQLPCPSVLTPCRSGEIEEISFFSWNTNTGYWCFSPISHRQQIDIVGRQSVNLWKLSLITKYVGMGTIASFHGFPTEIKNRSPKSPEIGCVSDTKVIFYIRLCLIWEACKWNLQSDLKVKGCSVKRKKKKKKPSSSYASRTDFTWNLTMFLLIVCIIQQCSLLKCI